MDWGADLLQEFLGPISRVDHGKVYLRGFSQSFLKRRNLSVFWQGDLFLFIGASSKNISNQIIPNQYSIEPAFIKFGMETAEEILQEHVGKNILSIRSMMRKGVAISIS